MIDEEIFYLIALTKVPKVGPILAKNLISYCGSAEAVFKALPNQLIKIPGIGTNVVDVFVDTKEYLREAEHELKFIDKNNISVLPYMSPMYPKRLSNFDSSPIVLYYKGNSNLNHFRTVAIVGTRLPSEYGRSSCEKIIEGLNTYFNKTSYLLNFLTLLPCHIFCNISNNCSSLRTWRRRNAFD